MEVQRSNPNLKSTDQFGYSYYFPRSGFAQVLSVLSVLHAIQDLDKSDYADLHSNQRPADARHQDNIDPTQEEDWA